MSDQKKIRAFHIHSNMSRHEMPKQLEKNVFKCPPKFEKIQSPKIEKCRTKKKIRAFHIRSNMSRHEMPKLLEKKVFKHPKNFEKTGIRIFGILNK